MSNKLTDLAIETLLIEKDIPFRIDYSKEDPLYRFNIDDFDIYVFSAYISNLFLCIKFFKMGFD